MAETLSGVPFVMHGARAAMASGLTHIEEQVEGIERAVENNPGLAFDLSKTLIESTCRTILSERGISFDQGDDLPKLFKIASKNLPFLPFSASGESDIRKSLSQTLSGLHTAVQGICELRNACGFASHGSESVKPTLETVQALLAAETADAIVGFLHRVHQQDRVLTKVSPLLRYEDNPDFNDDIDDIHAPVQIFQEEFLPSKIFFELATGLYKNYLGAYKTQKDTDEETTVGTKPEKQIP